MNPENCQHMTKHGTCEHWVCDDCGKHGGTEEPPHIIAECAKCHFRFDILFGVDCPQCRTEAVREAFSPIDPLRTALGVYGEDGLRQQVEEINGFRWHGKQPDFMRGKRFVEKQDTPEVPEGCKIPKGEAAQIWELRRMRKLIGRL